MNGLKISEVVRAVRSYGLTCRYSSEYQEFRIDYKRNDYRWTEDTAYFTTYRDDAVETAKVMSECDNNGNGEFTPNPNEEP